MDIVSSVVASSDTASTVRDALSRVFRDFTSPNIVSAPCDALNIAATDARSSNIVSPGSGNLEFEASDDIASNVGSPLVDSCIGKSPGGASSHGDLRIL